MTDSILDQLPAPYRAAWEITRSPFDFLSLLRRVMDAALQLAEAEEGFLVLMDDQRASEWPVIRMGPEMQPRCALGERLWLSYGLCQQAARESRWIAVAGAGGAPRWADETWREAFLPQLWRERWEPCRGYAWFRTPVAGLEEAKSMLAVPLMLQGQAVGVFYAQRSRRDEAFNAEQGAAVETFGGLIAETLVGAQGNAMQGGGFISSLNSELLNPLTAIHGYTELLLNENGGVQQSFGSLTDVQREFLWTISQYSRKCRELLSMYRASAYVQSGRWFYSSEWSGDLSRAIHKSTDGLRSKLETKRQNIEIVSVEIPPVLAAPYWLEKSVAVLLENAHHYTPEGGEIKITVSFAAGYVRCAVSDTGMGLTPDELPRLFQPYYRSERARDICSGWGMSLYLVKYFIERFGGEIGAQGAENQGSTFWFTLPAIGEAQQ